MIRFPAISSLGEAIMKQRASDLIKLPHGKTLVCRIWRLKLGCISCKVDLTAYVVNLQKAREDNQPLGFLNAGALRDAASTWSLFKVFVIQSGLANGNHAALNSEP